LPLARLARWPDRRMGRPIHHMQKSVSKNEVTGNFGEAFGRRLDTEGAVVLMKESGAKDPENEDD